MNIDLTKYIQNKGILVDKEYMFVRSLLSPLIYITFVIIKTIIEILISNEVTTIILLFTMSILAFMVIYQSYTQIRHIRLMEKFRKL